ncbi:MAG: hydrogenase maturation nickel metallochaperone HypA [Chloroflexi bacterium]|nr:hydrogenase maturation nickel metallochaperone HypA [Chloroflexota bacterium]
MHELAVTESIVEIVCRHAERAKAKRIRRIYLVIGDLSSIVDDSVQFYFDFVSQDTLAQGAKLVFRRIPVELVCEACGHRWNPPDADWVCPACGERRGRVLAGREFYVESIEVDT